MSESELAEDMVIVGTIGQFGGKDVTSYLEAYRAEIVMRDIPEYR